MYFSENLNVNIFTKYGFTKYFNYIKMVIYFKQHDESLHALETMYLLF